MEEHLLKSIINNNERQVSKIYYEHREAFLNFGKKFNLSYDDLVDIYQEAFIVLRRYAITGKLFDVESSLKTYLFGIGKFMIFDRIKELKKVVDLENFQIESSVEKIDSEFGTKELTIEQALLKKHFKNLGKRCKEVLTLFYSRGLTIDEIVEFADYSSNSVVRSQKSRCIKRLKEMIYE